MPMPAGPRVRAAAFILLALSILVAGCLQAGKPGRATALAEVQVDEYKGEKLSSVDDFRENSIKGPQYIDIGNYTLKVTGLVESPKNYTYGELLGNFKHYEKVVALNCVEGWSAKILWEGILVRDIFEEAKPKKEANTAIFHAYDGYTTSFPLEYFYGRDIIMAYKMNNVTIPPERGFPFQLVAESKWGYKWIKWITGIEFSNDESYKGYWESRGYSDSGNLNESFIR